jgi:hypothetical protein
VVGDNSRCIDALQLGCERPGLLWGMCCHCLCPLVGQRLLIAVVPAQPMYSGLTRKRVRYRSVPASIQRDNAVDLVRCTPSACEGSAFSHHYPIWEEWYAFLSDHRMQIIWWARVPMAIKGAQPVVEWSPASSDVERVRHGLGRLSAGRSGQISATC